MHIHIFNKKTNIFYIFDTAINLPFSKPRNTRISDMHTPSRRPAIRFMNLILVEET